MKQGTVGGGRYDCGRRAELIIDHHNTIREKDLIIQVAGHEAKSETGKLIELDPELEGPIQIGRISFLIHQNFLRSIQNFLRS
jgi:hypothetical protein